MGDAYWKRQGPTSAGGLLKRPRLSEYDLRESGRISDLRQSGLPSAHGMQNFLPRVMDRGGSGSLNDTQSIGSAYDRYLQSTQLTSMSSGEPNNHGGAGFGRIGGAGILNRPPADPSVMSRSKVVDGRGMGFIGRHPADALNNKGMRSDSRIPIDAPDGRGLEFDGGRSPIEAMSRPSRETVRLPPDASNTLYVDGLPSDCKMREVAHIFRPFVGYKEVRLVTKESRRRGEPVVLCFVDFISPACAATAMSALQGYKIDEHDSGSPSLRIQFSKSPGPKSSSHGRR